MSLYPCGSSVPNVLIQKSSLRSSVCRACSFVIVLSAISSIMMILKSSNVCPGSRKCLSIAIASSLLTSFRCLFILRLACWDSSFPTYCSLLHLSQKARYIALVDLHPVRCLISNLFFRDLSVKKLVLTMWVQHFASARPRHGVHLPFDSGFFLTTLFFLIRVCPKMSCCV